MKKPSAKEARPSAPESASAGDAPAPLRYLAYGAAAFLIVLLVALYARALPAAMARAKDGEHLARESACEALNATPNNAALGQLPAPAPDFTLKNYAGADVSLSSLRGQVVLVNFWATWCKTCVVEMASMEALVRKMRGKPFRLLAVSVDDDWPTVRSFFDKGTPLEVLLDTKRQVPQQFGTEQYPESFLIDKDGTVRYYVVSNREWDAPNVAACIEAMTN